MTDGEVTLTRSVVVEASPGRLFGMCEDAESLAPLLADVAAVERIGKRRHRWLASFHGTRTTWETEALRLDPPQRIEWRVPPNDERPGCAGALEFQPLPAGRTEVRLVLRSEGTPGRSVSDTSRILDDNLESFRSEAESRVRAEAGAERRLDADRAASMADEGGAAAAETAGGTPPSPSR